MDEQRNRRYWESVALLGVDFAERARRLLAQPDGGGVVWQERAAELTETAVALIAVGDSKAGRTVAETAACAAEAAINRESYWGRDRWHVEAYARKFREADCVKGRARCLMTLYLSRWLATEAVDPGLLAESWECWDHLAQMKAGVSRYEPSTILLAGVAAQRFEQVVVLYRRWHGAHLQLPLRDKRFLRGQAHSCWVLAEWFLENLDDRGLAEAAVVHWSERSRQWYDRDVKLLLPEQFLWTHLRFLFFGQPLEPEPLVAWVRGFR